MPAFKMYDLAKLAALEARYDGPIPQHVLATARVPRDKTVKDFEAEAEIARANRVSVT